MSAIEAPAIIDSIPASDDLLPQHTHDLFQSWLSKSMEVKVKERSHLATALKLRESIQAKSSRH